MAKGRKPRPRRPAHDDDDLALGRHPMMNRSTQKTVKAYGAGEGSPTVIQTNVVFLTGKFKDPSFDDTKPKVLFQLDPSADLQCRLITFKKGVYLSLQFVLHENGREDRVLYTLNMPSKDCKIALCLYRASTSMQAIKYPETKKKGGYAEMEWRLDYSGDLGIKSRAVWSLITEYLKNSNLDEIKHTNVPCDPSLPSVQLEERFKTLQQGQPKSWKRNEQSLTEEDVSRTRRGTENLDIDRDAAMQLPMPSSVDKHAWAATGMYEDHEFLKIFHGLRKSEVEDDNDADGMDMH